MRALILILIATLMPLSLPAGAIVDVDPQAMWPTAPNLDPADPNYDTLYDQWHSKEVDARAQDPKLIARYPGGNLTTSNNAASAGSTGALIFLGAALNNAGTITNNGFGTT